MTGAALIIGVAGILCVLAGALKLEVRTNQIFNLLQPF